MKLMQSLRLALVLSAIGFSAQAVTLKIATLSPEGSSWMQKFRESAKEIKARTDSRVKIKYYPGGVMGDDAAVLKKIRIRQLHGGAMTGGSLARFYKDSQVYSMPLKFDSLAQVEHVRSVIDPIIVEGFEEGGFVTFGLAGGGFAYLMSKEPITNPEQMKQHKVWTPSTDEVSNASFEAFDISPIPLPIGDVLAGLQTDLIDTIATSPVAAINLQWHTQLKYVTEVPIIYIYAVLAVDKKAFKKIKAADQKVVREVMTKVFTQLDAETRNDNQKALAALEKQGIEILKPSASDLAMWQEKAQLAEANLMKSAALSPSMIELLNKTLSSYNAKQSATSP
ncbi:TRAP transporter substrate-binding protein [Alteromonas sp. a30]|uniref:TRAP transporter substrate-binding protein n=1 Tax=Alteromonas sp. a30 TaxID=2730917 RepID=UPI00227FCAD9|nr:TRAP transporter substrate-binding protein DctP [Alteromonas sp. a30]MCY7295153.1 TRAP transporter substrate-binding protein DctP [Alteromonas sp. a30]